MRILLVSPEYPPYHIGGGGVVVQNLARTFVRMGHEVTVVTGYYPTKSILERVRATRDAGVSVFWLPLVPTLHVSFQLKTIMPPNSFSLAFLLKLLLNKRYDIINIHGYGHFINDLTAFCIRLFHKEYVATIHGIPKQPERQGGMLNNVFKVYSKTVGRVFFKWASTITAVSKHTAADSVVLGADPRKTVVIPNGVEPKMLARLPPSLIDGIARKYKLKDKKLVLGIGRLSEAKGFQFLLMAMSRILKEIPEGYLLIAGADGGYLHRLTRIIEDQNLSQKAKLVGEIDEETKRALYSLANVVVIPSLVEPFGIVALEAMAAGKPIVASDVEGLSELLKNRRLGFLIPPGSSDEIATQVITLLSHSQQDKKIAKSMLREVTSYRWENIGDLYVNAYLKAK